MKILALDASTEALSVAVLDSDHPADSREHFEIAPQAHARRLLPAAQTLLNDAGWRLDDLDGLAFGRGPGAFTGLRIAAGLVQGLAAGRDLPVAPVSTLAALAIRCASSHAARVQVVQDARMGEIYTATFTIDGARKTLRAVDAERVLSPDDFVPDGAPNTVRAGNGWHVLVKAGVVVETNIAATHPHALDIARLGATALARGDGVSAVDALPVYVRDDVARKSTTPAVS